MRTLKQIIYLLYEIIISYYVYCICVLFLKIGFNEISRDIYFIFFGMFLLFPLIKSYKITKGTNLLLLQNQYKINNNLKKLKNINKLYNPILKNENEKQQLDCIVITDKGVFNVVRSNLKGKIKILNDNEWYQKNGKNYIKVESPIERVKNYRKILRNAFKEDIIYDVIVMMEDRVKIESENNSNAPIISYHELKKFISEYNNKEIFKSDELYDKLYPYIYEHKDSSGYMNIYNKYIESKWKYIGRLAVILVSFVFYIKNIIII